MLRFVWTHLSRWLVAALALLALSVGANAFLVTSASAQHKMDADDLELPTNDMKVVEEGKELYSRRCSFCHGGGGKGGKGPCLTCGKFTYSGNRNIAIYTTIASGISNRSLGGTMGAFGTTMSMEEIVAVLTWIRHEEKRRIAAGEIPDPYASKD